VFPVGNSNPKTLLPFSFTVLPFAALTGAPAWTSQAISASKGVGNEGENPTQANRFIILTSEEGCRGDETPERVSSAGLLRRHTALGTPVRNSGPVLLRSCRTSKPWRGKNLQAWTNHLMLLFNIFLNSTSSQHNSEANLWKSIPSSLLTSLSQLVEIYPQS